MNESVGIVGIGVMGFHIACHIIKKKKLHILDRNSKKTKDFIKKFKNNKNLVTHKKLDDLSNNCSFIITCVGDDKDLNDIFFKKNGIMNGINNYSTIVDHTTASPKITRKLYKKLQKKNCSFFDAPMSGGEIGAKKGILSLMIGGDKLKFNKLKNILNLYSKSIVYMGKSGSGQLTKMVNQISVASVIQGLAEALNFAKKKKLNVDNLVEVIKNGAAQSWQLENRAKTMWNNKFNFGFMNKLMLKDLNLIFDENKTSKYKLPITNIIKKNYDELVKMGFSEEDTSNLIRLLK